jgi:hypothetical protein
VREIARIPALGVRTSLVLATVAVVAAAVAGRLARGRPLGSCWPGRLVALCLPWLVLPPVILLTASRAHPVYTFRYIVFCIPAAALLNVSSRRGADKGTGEHTMEAAYPYGLARLRDISTGQSPQQSGTLGGTYAPTPVIRARAATVRRIWVVEWMSPRPVVLLDGLGFRLVRRWDIQGLWLRLYVREATR